MKTDKPMSIMKQIAKHCLAVNIIPVKKILITLY